MKEDSPDRDSALATSRFERDRTLEAIHRLESALARASTSTRWSGEVTEDLTSLERAMLREQRELERPDSLLAMVAAENPRRFGSRVKTMRMQYEDLVRQIGSLRTQLGHCDIDAGEVRQRIGWIIRALHHCRAEQTDLVYEALERDLGER